MNQLEVHKIAAFVREGQGGNPAGVVLDAARFDSAARQSMAAEVGFSETAFVGNTGGVLSLEYFTPVRQIDICGHATVGAFSLLRDQGLINPGVHTFRSVAGEQTVEVGHDSVGLQQRQLRSERVEDFMLPSVAEAIGTDLRNVLLPLSIASNGSPFLFVEVRDHAALQDLAPDFEKLNQLSDQCNLVGVYIFRRCGEDLLEARMFAPRYGIPEESATGMAAGALALLLHRESGVRKFTVHQGHLMTRPSPAELIAEIRDDGLVIVSGKAVTIKG